MKARRSTGLPDARRLRTRLLVDAVRAAVIAFRDAVNEDARRTLDRLDQLEPWLAGGPEPDWFQRYRELSRLVHETVPSKREHEEELTSGYGAEMPLMDHGLAAVLDMATLATSSALDVEIGNVRRAIGETCGNSSSVHGAICAAFNAVLGLKNAA